MFIQDMADQTCLGLCVQVQLNLNNYQHPPFTAYCVSVTMHFLSNVPAYIYVQIIICRV